MKKNKIIAVFFSVLVLIVSTIIFILAIRNKSLPKKHIEITSDNIESSIEIYKNSQGVLHIISASDLDVFWGLGYSHAENNLWQMCLYRRIAQGCSAEILGIDYLEVDYFMRSLGITDIAKKLYSKCNSSTKKTLEKYADGINTYINQNVGHFPFEFDAFGTSPDLWKPEDCFLLQRYWAFMLSAGFSTEIALTEIAEKLGIEKALSLVSRYPTDGPYIFDDTVSTYNEFILPALDSIKNSLNINEHILSKKDNISNNNKFNNQFSDSFTPILDTSVYNSFNRVNVLLNKTSSSVGSNSWVVERKQSNSISNNTILANDIHLPLLAPATWNQVHISSPTYNVTGLTLPGIPIFFAGRNDCISWGVTNMLIDDIDFFIEKLTPDANFYYISETKTAPIKEYLDTIKIKNKDEKVFYMRYTNKSRIISDFKVINNLYQNHKSIKTSNVLTFRWCGVEISDEIGAALKFMKAKNWNEFLVGLNNWGSPSFTFSYTDTASNIGLAARGIIPKRGAENIPMLASPAWKNTCDWNGFYKSNSLGNVYNPKKKFIISANNPVSKNELFYTSYLWASPSRAKRIEEILLGGEFYTVRDAQYMQNDFLSIYARGHLKKLKYIFEKYKNLLSEEEKKAYNKLANWDFVMNKNSVSSSIYNMFISCFIYNTFHDELGDDLYNIYIQNTELILKLIDKLLENPYSDWYDNINTPEKENLEFVIIKSFKEAIKQLEIKFETKKINQWNYGKFHKINITPSFFSEKIFGKKLNNKLKNIGKICDINFGGNSTTLNFAEWDLSSPFTIKTATSMRFITDMSDSVIYTIIPGGNSGDAMSPNYSDQIQLWNIGAYIKIPISEQASSDFFLHTRIIKNK